MTSQQPCPWLTAREARERLGVSEITLARWRRSGLLRAGRDWLRKFPTPRSAVLYHLDQCEAVMNEATARSIHLLEPSLKAHRAAHPPLRAAQAGQKAAPGGGVDLGGQGCQRRRR